jgi:hypothetical protein
MDRQAFLDSLSAEDRAYIEARRKAAFRAITRRGGGELPTRKRPLLFWFDGYANMTYMQDNGFAIELLE